MIIHLLGLFLAIHGGSAGAMESKFIRCTRWLEAHPTTVAASTEKALHVLRQFRQDQLSSFPYEAGQEAVNANWQAGAPVKRRLTRRLTGLLEEDLPREGEWDALDFVAGHVFEGTRNILDEIKRRDLMIREINENKGQFIKSDFRVMLPLRIVTGALLAGSILSTVSWFLPTAVFAIPVRDNIEVALRTPLLFFYSKGHEQDFGRRVLRLQPGQWHYRSINIEVPTQMVLDRGKTFNVFSPHNMNIHVLYPSWTVKWTSRWLLLDAVDKLVRGVVRLRVDSLLHYGPRGPVWTEVIRVRQGPTNLAAVADVLPEAGSANKALASAQIKDHRDLSKSPVEFSGD